MRSVTLADPIPLEDLRRMVADRFGDLVKAVVDLERESMLIGGELQSDEESEMLAAGSHQENLWGINLYPDVEGEDWLEFDSMINIRPSSGNSSRGVDDPTIREQITHLVNRLVLR